MQNFRYMVDSHSPVGSVRFAVWSSLLVIAALLAYLYGRVAYELAQDWLTNPGFSHGIIIPPFAAYVTWLQRKRITAISPAPDLRGLWIQGLACLLYLLGRMAAEFFLMRVALVIELAGLLWTLWGWPRVRALAFPLLLLVTMVPLPNIVYNTLSSPLQLFATSAGTSLARLFGVAVFQDGNVINLAGLSLGVNEACSGLNSLSALLVTGVLAGFLVCANPLNRALVVVMGVPIAVAGNVLRVAGTAILADHNERYALGFYHAFSGWLVFILGCFTLLGIAYLLRNTLERRRTA